MKQANKAMFGSSTEYQQELVVSEILLDLGTLISLSESKREKFTWGVKRKRSALNDAPSFSRKVVKETELTRVKTVENNLASPNTPLSFLPSESGDSNNNGFMESLEKMTKEECVKMEEQLIQSRDCLRREIENVKRYYNKLKDENAELKAKKQQVLKTFHREENPQMEENKQVQYFGNNMVLPYQPIEVEFTGPLDFGHGLVNHVGPRGIPDLNISAEEAFGLDVPRPLDMNAVNAEKRARFAEARRLRRGIIKIKAMRSACGITMPTII